ncbi:hypothetical protein ACQEU3_02350 [Spirillospora sp. CA-253888]
MTTSRLPREELMAALAARKELGPDYDEAFLEAVVERLEESMTARSRPEPAPPARPDAARSGRVAGMSADLMLAVISVVLAVPFSAAATQGAGNTALFFALAAIVLVNAAHAWRGRR